jgi:hypothetical protein
MGEPGAAAEPEWLKSIGPPPVGDLVGYYENAPSSQADIVVIGIDGVAICQQKTWQVLDYREIVRVESPNPNGGQDAVRIRTRGGFFILPITGGVGRFRDVFAFVRFLERVRTDINKERPA